MNPILSARKRGESISYLFRTKQSTSPCLDDMIILGNIVRVCYENSLAFSFNEIDRLLCTIYYRDFHGSKEGCIKWLSKYLIKEPLLPKNKADLHESSKKLGDLRHDFSDSKEIPIQTYSELNLAHSEGGRNE